MAWFEHRDWRNDVEDNVAHHLTALRREVAALGGEAGRYGHKLADQGQRLAERYGQTIQHGAGEIGDVLARQGAVVAKQIGRQAQRAGKAVKDDPAPAIAALIGIACIASLVMARPAPRQGRRSNR